MKTRKEQIRKETERLEAILKKGPNKEDFILVPSLKMHVSKMKFFNNCSQYHIKEYLSMVAGKVKAKLLNLGEFIEFLSYIEIYHPKLFFEITEKNNKKRVELLDNSFKPLSSSSPGKLIMEYSIFDDGKKHDKNEVIVLSDIKNESGCWISFEEWLESPKKSFGLPSNNISLGEMIYFPPLPGGYSGTFFSSGKEELQLNCSSDMYNSPFSDTEGGGRIAVNFNL